MKSPDPCVEFICLIDIKIQKVNLNAHRFAPQHRLARQPTRWGTLDLPIYPFIRGRGDRVRTPSPAPQRCALSAASGDTPGWGGGRRRWRSGCAGGTPPTGTAMPSAHSRTRAAPVTAAEVIRALPLYGKLSQATQRRAPQFQSETRGRKRRVLKRRGSHAQCCVGATCLGRGRPGPQDVNQQE